MLELGKLHHVAIIGSDYDASKDFYVNKLGLPLIREVWRPERQDHILTLLAGDVQIELFIMPGHPARVTNPEANGLRHLCFYVPDVAQAAQELNRRGIETEPIRLDPYTNTRAVFFRDPDDLPLELHE